MLNQVPYGYFPKDRRRVFGTLNSHGTFLHQTFTYICKQKRKCFSNTELFNNHEMKNCVTTIDSNFCVSKVFIAVSGFLFEVGLSD